MKNDNLFLIKIYQDEENIPIACITDDHCVLRESMLDQYARRVLHSQGYGKTEVHFVINGVLYKYNSQGRILG